MKILYDNCGFNATDAIKNFVKWEKLESRGMQDSAIYKMRAGKMVCLGHNHALFKPEDYKNEKEWRIIIPNNRYVEYFGKADVYTKDFSPLMQAIYLGSEFRNTDINGEMYEYALEVCKNFIFRYTLCGEMMTNWKKIWNIILPKNSVKIEILADFLLSKNTDELWAILSNLVRVSPS